MIEFSQFVAGGSAEVGIQGQYFDGELHLVDDTLAGTVATREKLKIGLAIIRALAVDVVNCFFAKQGATEFFRHDVAVFHDRVLFPGYQTGNSDPHVAMTFDVLAEFSAIEFIQRFGSLVRGFAFRVAIFLLFVYAAARLTAFRIFFAAFEAGKGVARFACFAATNARALPRAVQRISCIFLMVGGDEGFHHRKPRSAFNAGEFYRDLCFGEFFVEAVRTSARETAVLSVFAREAGKRLLAVFTDFLNRHRWAPLFGDEGTLLMSIGIVK
jgi:hypothetical protein